VTIPTSDEQIRFLVNLQRLLDEGQFNASYKYALLLSLADLCVEKGNDSGLALPLTTGEISGKFIQYYWRQAIPYPASAEARVLKQNKGRQASIVNLLVAARRQHGDSLVSLMRQAALWERLRGDVAYVIREMPLWKLQTIAGNGLDFLYENVRENTGMWVTIELRPSVAYCFRKFHPMISDLVRGAWLRYVRQQNIEILGETTDLNQFLFGSERAALTVVRPALIDIQQGRCFYCNKSLSPLGTHVDHFIAWSRYPIDLGHNFVLADNRCNSQKCDRLPATVHLAAWNERNRQFGNQIGNAMKERGVIADLPISNGVAQWAYEQTESANGLTWIRADELEPLNPRWRTLFDSRQPTNC
jgi:hypothetical protein